MSKPLSAVDCVSPAIAHAKKQLFAPFRWGRWARLALICLLTGEGAGGGGGGPPVGNFNLPTLPTPHSKGGRTALLAIPHIDWGRILPWLPWVLLGIVLLFSLFLLWIYVSSVFRFVLFDSVLHDRCAFKGCWTEWEPCGRSYFFWSIALFIATGLGTGLIIGTPLLIAWRTGMFEHPGDHIAALILGGLAFLFILAVFVVAAAVTALFAKDFCVAIMAMEKVGVMDAWRRLFPMLSGQKMSFTGYVLMKIVLSIAAAIIVGIATLLILLALLIILGIVAVIVFFGGKAIGLSFNVATISILAVLGGVIFAGLIYLFGLISTAPMVFFQSYTLHFIGSRYPAVGEILFPPPPEPPPLPPLDAPPIPEPAIG